MQSTVEQKSELIGIQSCLNWTLARLFQRQGEKLSKTRPLRGPGGSPLSVPDTFDACLTSDGNEIKEKLYVIKNQTKSLL